MNDQTYFAVSTLFIERKAVRNLFGLLNRFSMLDVGFVRAANKEQAVAERQRFLSGSFYSFSVKGVHICYSHASEIPYYVKTESA